MSKLRYPRSLGQDGNTLSLSNAQLKNVILSQHLKAAAVSDNHTPLGKEFLGQLSLPSLLGRQMRTSFGWESKRQDGSFR